MAKKTSTKKVVSGSIASLMKGKGAKPAGPKKAVTWPKGKKAK